jgi:hypothetical protein
VAGDREQLSFPCSLSVAFALESGGLSSVFRRNWEGSMADASEKPKASIGELIIGAIKLAFVLAFFIGGGLAYLANNDRERREAALAPVTTQTEAAPNSSAPDAPAAKTEAVDLAFGTSGHVINGGTMACVLRQALAQVVAIANEIGKHPERHATDAAFDVAEKIGCRAVNDGTAIEIVDRVGPYVQYHEPGNAELLWTISDFVGP